ncbi:MAG: hypothetical protein JWQ04_1233 [Pedosphaera sp.]|nr:hypothetical protein [Pedosphaera sp.]
MKPTLKGIVTILKAITGRLMGGKAMKKAKKEKATSEAERLDRIRNPDKYLNQNPAGW